MTQFERRQQLIVLLSQQPGTRVPELAAALQVSQGTVRNDLDALEVSGLLTRVRGGASLNGRVDLPSPSFQKGLQEQAAAKQAIARWAAELVQDGDSILLDASSTVYYLAQQLHGRKGLRVITSGIDVARSLAQNPTNTVILLGGVLNPDGSSVTGPIAQEVLRDLYSQTAFVSCSGFSLEAGLTDVHLYEAELKKSAVLSAARVIALVDSSKFGKVDLTSFARPEMISHLFTDEDLSPEWAARLQAACLPYSLCSPERQTIVLPERGGGEAKSITDGPFAGKG